MSSYESIVDDWPGQETHAEREGSDDDDDDRHRTSSLLDPSLRQRQGHNIQQSNSEIRPDGRDRDPAPAEGTSAETKVDDHDETSSLARSVHELQIRRMTYRRRILMEELLEPQPFELRKVEIQPTINQPDARTEAFHDDVGACEGEVDGDDEAQHRRRTLTERVDDEMRSLNRRGVLDDRPRPGTASSTFMIPKKDRTVRFVCVTKRQK